MNPCMNQKSTRFFLLATSLLLPLVLFFCGCGKAQPNDANAGKGELTIISSPSAASVYMLGDDRGVTPKEVKRLPPGCYVVKLSKPGYKSVWEKVEITPGSKKSLEVTLKPLTAAVLFTSVPSGATIEYDGKDIGVTPLTLSGLPVGRHSAIVKMLGFSQKEINWDLENERPVLLKTELASNKGILTIDSEPSNAAIYLNNLPRGNTPFNESVEQGNHTLRIEKDGYAVFETQITVSRDKATPVNAVLTMLPSSLRITSIPEGATVFVNGTKYSNTPFELKSLTPGTYQVRLEKAGFDPASRDVTVTPGQNFDVELSLDSNTGGIELTANPPGITVYLDGKKVGTTEPDLNHPGQSKVFQLKNLSMGRHTIMIAHKRARPEKRTITLDIAKGETIRLPSITMWIPNVIIKLKSGKQYTGRMVNTASDKAEEIMFEPEPGIRQSYKREDISGIVHLKENE